MPIYEYRCPKCGTVYEETRRIEDRDKPVKCGKCGVNAVKIISGFASKTGFYLRPSAAPHRKAGG